MKSCLFGAYGRAYAASNSTQIDTRGHDRLAGLGIGIDGGETHALRANLFDGHLRSSITIDLFGPGDPEINDIARALTAKSRGSSSRADI